MRSNIQTNSEGLGAGPDGGYGRKTRCSDTYMGGGVVSDTSFPQTTSPDTITPPIGNLGEALLAAMKKETTP
jgi:hypothetical protein